MRVATGSGHIELDVEGTGETVLLLHGVPGSRGSWRPVVPLLAETHRVVVPDLLGFGGSSRPRALHELHARAQARAVVDVLDALGEGRVSVVGHDFGGPVALTLLASAPDRVARIGLLATNAFPDTPIPPPLNTLNWPLVGPLMERALMSRPALHVVLRTGVGLGGPTLDAATYLGDRGQIRTIRTLFGGSLRDLPGLFTPVRQALDLVDVPATVVWGDRDPFFTVELGRRTAAAMGAAFTVLEGAGHFLPEERPAEVAAVVRDLLSRDVGESTTPRLHG